MPKIPTSVKSTKLVEKRREQITNAAIKLFSLKGFHRTTLRDLAEETGIGHGNIYAYVGNKEDILLLIHEDIKKKAYAIMEAAEDIKNPLEKLRRMIQGEIDASYTWREATLLFYQEIKSLDRERLRELSATERKRLERYEKVIEECIQEGQCKNVNPRLISNLTKVMADIWPLKGWDLKGQTTKHQIEKTVLDGVFNGLLGIDTANGSFQLEQSLKGMRLLIVNPGRTLGKALFPFFLSSGFGVVTYHGSGEISASEFMKQIPTKRQKDFHAYDRTGHGPMNVSLFQKIVSDVGQIDAVVYNWGFLANEGSALADQLDKDFRQACELVPALKEGLSHRNLGQVIHLAPTYWNRDKDSILYDVTKSKIVGLTESLASDFAERKIRINCIIPGYIDGLQPFKRSQELEYRIHENNCQERLGKVDDIMECLRFLLSEKSNYITGQILSVNGGMR